MATKTRKVLVILSNRYHRSQHPRYVEILCRDNGDVLKETPVRRVPKSAAYDEVWENDDGKTSLSSCTRFKRKYRHPLEKPKKS